MYCCDYLSALIVLDFEHPSTSSISKLLIISERNRDDFEPFYSICIRLRLFSTRVLDAMFVEREQEHCFLCRTIVHLEVEGIW